jgi:prevent-host-death family protein
MAHETRTVEAAEFKARCLALLKEVAATGLPIVVTQRGQALARIEPMRRDRGVDLRGSVMRESDLIGPVDEPWRADAPLKSNRRR